MHRLSKGDRAVPGVHPTVPEIQMKILPTLSALALLVGIAVGVPVHGQDRNTFVVTASNTPTNNLLVYDASNRLIQSVATGGEGGVSGNSGGIAASHDRLAVVNF